MNLRPMKMEDADFMLELKNDPDTRRFAIKSHEEIKKEDHYQWLKENIHFFQIIMGYTHRIGAIRVENHKEISIWIAKDFRGLGVACEVIKQIVKPYMTAKIVHGNIASMRTFIKAGF